MAVATLRQDQVVSKPRQLPTRAIFGVFLALLSLLGGIWVLSSRDTVTVLVAARDLPTGAVIQATDLTQASVRLDASLLPATIPASQASTLVGRMLAEPVHAGQLIGSAEFRQGAVLAQDRLAMTIAPNPERGAIGQFEPGDRVRVLVTSLKPDSPPVTRVVLQAATVYDVGYGDSVIVADPTLESSSGVARPVVWLSVAVTEAEALALANAKSSGELDVALLSPSMK